MRGSAGKPRLSSFAVPAVFVIFAICVICVLLAGAGTYGRMVSEGQESYEQRSCAQYISTRLRQCEAGDRLSVEDFGGVTALVLEEAVEGAAYCTRVYCLDGWLMELYSARGADFAPEDGEKLLPAAAMVPERTGGGLTVTLEDASGETQTLFFALRGGEGGRHAK